MKSTSQIAPKEFDWERFLRSLLGNLRTDDADKREKAIRDIEARLQKCKK